MWVDPVLLPAAMPGDRHLGPDTADIVLALHEPFPCGQHRASADGYGRGLGPTQIFHEENRPWSIHNQRRVACARYTPVAGPLVTANSKRDMPSRTVIELNNITTTLSVSTAERHLGQVPRTR